MPAKRAEKTPMPQRAADARAHDFVEVNEGYTPARAVFESERCLRCQDPVCVAGCPVQVPMYIILGSASNHSKSISDNPFMVSV